MKKILSALVLAVVMIFSANCSAADYSRSITQLNKIIGNWYDSNGNLVMTISSDYKVNGRTVVSLNQNADVYKIRIDEGGKYKDIELYFSGSWGFSDYHEMLVMNTQTTLRRTKNSRHFESVGGIYLGMNKNQVVSKYGQPSKIENRDGYVRTSTWKYNREGFDLKFEYDAVTEIKIYPYGDRKFDWSGLSARDSKSDFIYKYNMKNIRGNWYYIEYGEGIGLYNDYVVLGIRSGM